MKPFPVAWLQTSNVPSEVWLAWGDGRFLGVFPTMLQAHERVSQEADNGRVLRYNVDQRMLLSGKRRPWWVWPWRHQ